MTIRRFKCFDNPGLQAGAIRRQNILPRITKHQLFTKVAIGRELGFGTRYLIKQTHFFVPINLYIGQGATISLVP